MTKEELKAYISEAVDALKEGELEMLFPQQPQPDLYAMMEEVVGLKGAFNKLSGSTLRLNQEVQTLIENTAISGKGEGKSTEDIVQLESQLKGILWRLIDMDELLSLTVNSIESLPILSKKNIDKFKEQYTSWKKGFAITLDRWEKLLQSNNLQKTGQTGALFNPEIHEAVGVKNWTNIEDNIIIETEQIGFLFNGQLLRTAKVVVNRIPAGITKTSLETDSEIITTPTTHEPAPAKKKKKKKKKKRKKESIKSYIHEFKNPNFLINYPPLSVTLSHQLGVISWYFISSTSNKAKTCC